MFSTIQRMFQTFRLGGTWVRTNVVSVKLAVVLVVKKTATRTKILNSSTSNHRQIVSGWTAAKKKLCTVIRLSVRITWGIIRHYYLLFMYIFIFQYMFIHVCVSFYISIFELSLCIHIFISVSTLLDSHSGLSSNSKPGRPNGINFRGFLLAALDDTGHTRPAENQSIIEEKHSLSCRSSSRPPSSSPSDKTVWIKLRLLQQSKLTHTTVSLLKLPLLPGLGLWFY